MNPARTRFPRHATPPSYAGTDSDPAPGWSRIAPQTGVAVELEPGDRLTVLDPLGEQVSDKVAALADWIELNLPQVLAQREERAA